MVSYFLVCGFLADEWTSPQIDFTAGSAGLMSPVAVECCTKNSRPRLIRSERSRQFQSEFCPGPMLQPQRKATILPSEAITD